MIEYFNGSDHNQIPGGSSQTGMIGDYISALPGGGFVMGYNFDPNTPIDTFRGDWFDNKDTYLRSADASW